MEKTFLADTQPSTTVKGQQTPQSAFARKMKKKIILGGQIQIQNPPPTFKRLSLPSHTSL